MWLNDNMPDEIIALKDWSWKFKKKNGVSKKRARWWVKVLRRNM